jgi:aromatic ring-cleaving dioxygenase
MPDDQPKPVSDITAWHAHVYYDPTTRDRAARLRDWVAERFAVQMGRWHDVPVGPHARAMYQIAFDVDVFPTLVPFLALNRMGLSILVHPNTDDAYTDHLEHALWLGEKLPLNGSVLPRSLRAAGQPPEQVVPNTKPSG